MINILRKHDFPLRIERLFTGATDPFDLVPWREASLADRESSFEAPAHWSDEAIAVFAEAAGRSIPFATRPVEENTVPSWLWRRQPGASADHALTEETDARRILHRVAGSATYAGWKQGIFASEDEARSFYDEIRYLLAQRYMALDPALLATAGLDWAYGIENKPPETSTVASVISFEGAAKTGSVVEIRNASIDALLGGDEKIAAKWDKFLALGVKNNFLGLRFADIAADWSAAPSPAAAAALDLYTFRREDNAIDVERLGHAARLLAIFLELSNGKGKAIGFQNLAPLLMTQGMAYDSNVGRTTAAAVAALIAAEACIASAQMAAMLGPSLDFAAYREGVLRALRNHRRAAYGDRADYEKVSVLPVPLALDPGADLALTAAARHYWDEALELARQYGLRTTQFTDLTLPAALSYFMESASVGASAMPALTVMRAEDDDLYRREIHPAVAEALFKLDYDVDARTAIIAHIAGTGTLQGASGIDHGMLRRKGFDDRTLEEIENYLAYAGDIRLAITPWIVGEDFCRNILKISADKIRAPDFDLLRALGFSMAEIEAANRFVYGCGTARGAPVLKPAHASVLALAAEIPAEAQIRMHAAVQSFLSGDAGLVLRLGERATAESIGRILLGAWRQGVKSLTAELAEPKQQAEITSRAPAQPAARPHAGYSAPLRSTLRGKPKAQGKLVSLKRGRPDKPDRPGKA